MAKEDYAELLGNAWAQHRLGNQDAAIQGFQQILKSAPNQIDALFGLGLAQRNAGQREAAAATFKKCAEQIDNVLVENPHEDRYEMLKRMVNQRLHEMDVQVNSSTRK